jgi:hypothetical protein
MRITLLCAVLLLGCSAKEGGPPQFGLCEQNPAKDCDGVKGPFTTETPELLAVGRFPTVPKPGSKITTKWIAVDVGKAAPPNTVIDQSVVEVAAQNEPLQKGSFYTVRGTLSRPNKGWPPGSYKAEWAMDGQPLGATEFQIR